MHMRMDLRCAVFSTLHTLGLEIHVGFFFMSLSYFNEEFCELAMPLMPLSNIFLVVDSVLSSCLSGLSC